MSIEVLDPTSDAALGELTSWDQARTLYEYHRSGHEIVSPLPTVVEVIKPSPVLREAVQNFSAPEAEEARSVLDCTYRSKLGTMTMKSFMMDGPYTGQLLRMIEPFEAEFEAIAKAAAEDVIKFTGGEYDELELLMSNIWFKKDTSYLIYGGGLAHIDRSKSVQHLWVVGPNQTRWFRGRFTTDLPHSQVEVSGVTPIVFEEGSLIRFYPTSVHEQPERFDEARLLNRISHAWPEDEG